MPVRKPIAGAQLVPARLTELRRVLRQISADDLDALDPVFGQWMRRPLGQEALASMVLPVAGTLYVCLMNIEPAGLIVLERGEAAARVRALAVTPDMRRRGVAQSMLALVEAEVRARGIGWMWMLIAAESQRAARTALRAGYRRYRPQFLRRSHPGLLKMTNHRCQFEQVVKADEIDEATHWISYESNIGDAWCAELAQADLLKLLAPNEGNLFRCMTLGRDIGLAHIEWTARSHLRMTLWLEQHVWGTPLECDIFKGVLDMLQTRPDVIDLEFGSSEHLRASVPLFRPFGFEPTLFERVTFVKAVVGEQDDARR